MVSVRTTAGCISQQLPRSIGFHFVIYTLSIPISVVIMSVLFLLSSSVERSNSLNLISFLITLAQEGASSHIFGPFIVSLCFQRLEPSCLGSQVLYYVRKTPLSRFLKAAPDVCQCCEVVVLFLSLSCCCGLLVFDLKLSEPSPLKC